MTTDADRRCAQCGEPQPAPRGPGRPRTYCDEACQLLFKARRLIERANAIREAVVRCEAS